MKRIPVLLAVLVSLTVSARAFDAAACWNDQCAKCHGKEGAGETKMGKKLSIKDYTDAKVQAEFTDEDAFKAIKEGTKDKSGKVRMKAVEGLTDDDIAAMVKYFRTLRK
jgi:cytochrome c553